MTVGQENERQIARAITTHLAEACSSFSTSAGVKYSRVRRSRFLVRRGGMTGEEAARDRFSGAFVARPRGGTFPFFNVGSALSAAFFFEDFGILKF